MICYGYTRTDRPNQEESRNEQSEGLERALRIAFEDQIVQKVMPKLRGIETEGTAAADCLIPIKNTLVQAGLGLTEDFGLAMSTGYGEFVWKSAKYLTLDSEDTTS